MQGSSGSQAMFWLLQNHLGSLLINAHAQAPQLSSSRLSRVEPGDHSGKAAWEPLIHLIFSLRVDILSQPHCKEAL